MADPFLVSSDSARDLGVIVGNHLNVSLKYDSVYIDTAKTDLWQRVSEPGSTDLVLRSSYYRAKNISVEVWAQA